MVSLDDYGRFETAWCPGCGNHGILQALKKALADSGLEPHNVLLVSGIGQAAKAPHYLRANVFNGLHGRSLPVATGAKLANPHLTVIAQSGDGCQYGEGGNHFLAALRRNPDITILAHNNQVYGLTKGQASPTSHMGFMTKAQPEGVHAMPFNPVGVAVTMKAGFVARGFSGEIDHLAGLIQEGIKHPGAALIDILMPCVSFNHINTFAWYRQRCRPLPEDYDPTDWSAAVKTADQWGDEIPIGVIYRNQERPPFGSYFPALSQGPLARQGVNREELQKIINGFG